MTSATPGSATIGSAAIGSETIGSETIGSETIGSETTGKAAARLGSPRTWLDADVHREVTRRSLAFGIFLLAVHLALYGATLAIAVADLPWWINLPAAVMNGLFIGLIFIIGHDTSHGAFVPGRRLNQILTRIAFIPCAHSASLWDLIHNRTHHQRTNLKGVDYAWVPTTKAEYEAMNPVRRWLERAYRGPFGPFLYYYIEFWFTRAVLPTASDSRLEWRKHVPDTLFVLTALVLTLAGIAWLGTTLAPARSLWLTMTLGWFIPFSVWNYLISLTTYMQHTHPSVPWFNNEREWSLYDGNVRGTAQVDFLINVAPLWSWVMQHNAHHLATGIPVYRLTDAQARLRQRFDLDMVRYQFSLSTYFSIMRACKLYDFERNCWTDFAGNPTGPALLRNARNGHPVASTESA